MLFLLATLAASATTPTVVRTPEPAAASGRCGAASTIYAKNRAGGRAVRRLGEEPPATEYLAVDRYMGGCPVPAVVRTGIGR